MACALQSHLHKKKINWKIVHGDGFTDFNRVLDAVMQERATQCIGTIRRQADVISMEFENNLWDTNVLGEDTPDKLKSTVLFLLGVNSALRAGDEHYAIRRPGGCVPSQLSFEQNSAGIRCLVYREDTVTKTNRGGLRDMKKDRKIVWIKPNSNVNRWPVRLIEKYIKLLPTTGAKPNFYLQSLRFTKPKLWYCETPLGINKVRSVVSDMLKHAGLDGFFTNHSLRRTAATHLFRAGKNVKLIKEITGHVSDAVEKYEITSDQQRMELSSIIQGEKVSETIHQSEGNGNINGKQAPVQELHLEADGTSNFENKENSINNVIKTTVQATGNRKARVSITIDFLD